jgi:predicted nucleic acid-binding protein
VATSVEDAAFLSTNDFIVPQSLTILDVTEPTAHRAAMIHKGLNSQGQRIGLGDALIAGTALESGLILVTRRIPSSPTFRV